MCSLDLPSNVLQEALLHNGIHKRSQWHILFDFFSVCLILPFGHSSLCLSMSVSICDIVWALGCVGEDALCCVVIRQVLPLKRSFTKKDFQVQRPLFGECLQTCSSCSCACPFPCGYICRPLQQSFPSAYKGGSEREHGHSLFFLSLCLSVRLSACVCRPSVCLSSLVERFIDQNWTRI